MARDRAARPGAKPHRLFVGVEIPEEVKDLVAGSVEPWRMRFPQARWAPRENWHMTVKFLGPTYPRLMGWVPQRVAEAAAGTPPVKVRVFGLGCFPSRDRARILWAGLEDPAGGMRLLARRLDNALAGEFAPERRAFTAHLTLARSDPPLRLPEDFAATPLESAWFDVERLVLFRSHLRRPAPVYEPLATFALGT